MKGPEHFSDGDSQELPDGCVLDPVWRIPSRNTGRGVYCHGELKDLIVRKRRETDKHATGFMSSEVRGLKGPGVMAVRLETRRSCLE
jgi:hypothetical protein